MTGVTGQHVVEDGGQFPDQALLVGQALLVLGPGGCDQGADWGVRKHDRRPGESDGPGGYGVVGQPDSAQDSHCLGGLAQDGPHGLVAQGLGRRTLHIVLQGQAGIRSGDDQGDPVPGMKLIDRGEVSVLPQGQPRGCGVDQVGGGGVVDDEELAVPVQYLVAGPPGTHTGSSAQEGGQGVSAENGISDMRFHGFRTLAKVGALLPRGGATVDGWSTPGIVCPQHRNPLLGGAYRNNPNGFLLI